MTYKLFPAILFGVLTSALAHASEPVVAAPKPAPGLFATDTFGIIARIPRGLTYCPLPSNWIGSNHGTDVYLVPPAGCDEGVGYVSAGRPLTTIVPTISIYYGYNVLTLDSPNYSGPPRNAEELKQIICDKPYLPLPEKLVLLDMPAVGCRHDHGDQTEIKVMQVYRLDHANRENPSEPPDAELEVTLYSSKPRLADDLKSFRATTRSITQCTPGHARPTRRWPTCPQNAFW